MLMIRFTRNLFLGNHSHPAGSEALVEPETAGRLIADGAAEYVDPIDTAAHEHVIAIRSMPRHEAHAVAYELISNTYKNTPSE